MTEQELRVSVGAYVLGALEPAEALEVQQHLPGCRDCQREYLELTEVLPALAALPRGLAGRVASLGAAGLPADLAAEMGADSAPAPPDDLAPRRTRPRVEAGTRRSRRRPRIALAAVAAAAALAAAPVGVAVLADRSPAHAPTQAAQDTTASVATVVTFTGTNAATSASVTVTLRPDGPGTQVEALLTGVGRGMVCHLVTRLASGEQIGVGAPARVQDPNQSTRLAGRLPVPIDEVAAVDVVDAKGVMVTARR
jgi:anti-sigma factor RsiW